MFFCIAVNQPGFLRKRNRHKIKKKMSVKQMTIKKMTKKTIKKTMTIINMTTISHTVILHMLVFLRECAYTIWPTGQ